MRKLSVSDKFSAWAKEHGRRGDGQKKVPSLVKLNLLLDCDTSTSSIFFFRGFRKTSLHIVL